MTYTSIRAFTLVETLVAVSVLLLVVVGPMTITARTTKSASLAAEQVVAHFLAQEGLEFAKRARDEELLRYLEELETNPTPSFSPWDIFTNTDPTSPDASYRDCYGTAGCGLTLRTTGTSQGELATPQNCAVLANCRLKLSDQHNDRVRYRHDPSSSIDNSPYTRVIRFQHTGDWVRVISEVTWRSGSLLATQRVQLETYLLNVYDL